MSRKRKPRRYINPTTVAVSVAAGMALLVLGAVAWYSAALRPVSSDTQERLVTVHQLGVKALARHLKAAGLIRNATAFRLMAQSNMALDKTKRPQAGFYDLSPSMSSEEIWNRICGGKVAKRKVTFPEGFTLEQMALRLQREIDLPAHDFLLAARGRRVSRKLPFTLPSGKLEGYLFPTTYRFPVGADAETVVGEMLATFNEVFYKPYLRQIKDNRLSLHQIVTLASLVEREARLDRERPLIAGVLLNRLKRGMRLQCDATVQYALGGHKTRLLYSDLKVASPYNTYLHAGLPPGPICNPGLPSLRAALAPQASPYLFYVARPDGSHVFTRTYQEHLQAIKQIRRQP